ncbi:MAG: 4Fe-4S binding protein, partial [Firmicutes bacterium]|nr:4Fe-4S binding protein [Bacillota bacterium]
VGAISIHETTGAILIDHDKCTVCGLCIEACEESRTGCLRLSNEGDQVVGMCDLCDGNPVCVTYCPENVLQILGKMHSTVGYARKPREIAEDVYEFLYSVV